MIRLTTRAPVHARTFFTAPAQSFSATKILPYAQADLFKIVSDVDSYADFIPFCKASKVTSRDEYPTTATLQVGYKTYDEEFTSKVKCTPDTLVSATASKHPLFDQLTTQWRLNGHGNGTKVTLHVDYKFTNPLYAALSNAVMPKISDTIIAAFEKRATELLKHKE